jgi:23S rRNA (cytidine1920-2'-O)/16S rRNA (cytidine1409-2'-O)-methyltransferase
MYPSRTSARTAIEAGEVVVAGVPTPKPATMVEPGAAISSAASASRFVGRGGLKLEAALEAFPIDVAGRRALDVGASTGGFTDCLLQRGAAAVVALDVGYGQLDWRLRSDDRVATLERTNIRHVDLAGIGAPFDVVVADLSFIGLSLVAPHLVAATAPDGDLVVLVKPQFEVGKGQVGKGGIVRDPELHRSAIDAVVAAFEDEGCGAHGLVASPIEGTKGNREFLLWVRRGPRTMQASALDEVVIP